MWRWKVVSGWRWRCQGEHINSLELRAILACLRWRCEHVKEHSCRILHLTDSLVYASTASHVAGHLPDAFEGRFAESTRLCWPTTLGGLWGYVHTDLNPADKPSR